MSFFTIYTPVMEKPRWLPAWTLRAKQILTPALFGNGGCFCLLSIDVEKTSLSPRHRILPVQRRGEPEVCEDHARVDPEGSSLRYRKQPISVCRPILHRVQLRLGHHS